MQGVSFSVRHRLGENAASATVRSPQQCLESGLFEMVVSGQGFHDSMLLHDDERNASENDLHRLAWPCR
jgi:hypothetical protein